MSSYEHIDYSLDETVAFIRFNDPDRLNALSNEMGLEFIEALDQAAAEAGAIVVGGHGRAFSSGANLNSSTVDFRNPERDIGASLDTVFNPMILKLRDLPIPVITAVRGAAAGVGCSIALMGDLIVAGRGAFFLQAFSRIGLVPDGGSAYLLARSIGRVRAMEMMLLGERFPADQALEAGLINRLVDDDDVDRVALELAGKLARGPGRALSLIRRSAWAALDSTLEEQLQRERRFQFEAGRTEDFEEGVNAFLEKRQAQFRGR